MEIKHPLCYVIIYFSADSLKLNQSLVLLIGYAVRKIPGLGDRMSIVVLIAIIDLTILANTEKASYLKVFFEIISALGNTGLSAGITPALTSIGKIVLIITMFLGRVGPATIAMALFFKPHRQALGYPQEDIFVG